MFNRSRFFTTLLSNSWEELTLPGAACFPIHKKILKINRFLQTNKKSTYKMSQSYVFADGQVYKAIGSDRIMFATDLWYRWHWLLIASQFPYFYLFRSDGELRAIAEEFAYDNSKFVQTVVAAWDKLTTADRWDSQIASKIESLSWSFQVLGSCGELVRPGEQQAISSSLPFFLCST